MSDNERLEPIRNEIVIRHAPNRKGSDTGNMLKGCFFLPTEIKGFYNFYEKGGQTLATGVSSDKAFPILLGDLAWTIQMGKIDDLEAQGTWRNNAPGPAEDQDGSFQASSGPGVPTESNVESVSADAPTGAIVIGTVSGDSDKDKLKQLYFMGPVGTSSTYNLYSKNGKLLASGLLSGVNFTFPHDDITWTVTEFLISPTAASGHWSNPDNPTADQSGTFQASSGPGVDEKEATSAASAS